MSKLYVEKYHPLRLEQLDYNDNVTELISKLAKKSNFTHLIFYGPEGAGKKTRIKILLQLLFNESVHKLRIESKELKINSTKVEYIIASSDYHIELNPSDSGNNDRHIIQSVIKETASTKTLNIDNKHKSKVIIIHEADNLSKEAQSSLRRTMEKYMGNCRIIMTCVSLSKIISPIRSRCLAIRIPAPDNRQISKILFNIKKQENINLSDLQIEKIVQTSNRNLRSAIFNLQICIFLIKLIPKSIL